MSAAHLILMPSSFELSECRQNDRMKCVLSPARRVRKKRGVWQVGQPVSSLVESAQQLEDFYRQALWQGEAKRPGERAVWFYPKGKA